VKVVLRVVVLSIFELCIISGNIKSNNDVDMIPKAQFAVILVPNSGWKNKVSTFHIVYELYDGAGILNEDVHANIINKPPNIPPQQKSFILLGFSSFFLLAFLNFSLFETYSNTLKS